jgi:hypothetical protein
MPKLEIKSGKAAGHTVDLSGSTVTLGNRRNATVELKDPWVSFNHAKITREGDRYFIADMRSKAGTFLNQKRVDAPTPLSAGDKILLGKTEIHFIADGPAAPAPSAPAASAAAPALVVEEAPPAPPAELLERLASLERDLAAAQKDAKNLREALVARDKLLADANSKLHAAEHRAALSEKAAEAAAKAPPPPPPPPPPQPGASPDVARWQQAYNDLKARYDDVVHKAKSRIDDLTARLEAAQKASAAPAAPAIDDKALEELKKKYEAEIKGYEAALDDRNKDVARLEEALEKAATQIAEASAEADDAPAAVETGADPTEELGETTKKVEELTRVNADLRQQLEEINTDMLEQEEELRGEIAELERKLQEATQQS